MFKKIDTNNSGKISSSEFNDVVDTNFQIWNVAANLTQPLFNGGQLRAQMRRAQANYDEALANFNQTVLVAFREVEEALAAERFFRIEEEAQTNAEYENRMAAQLAWEEYTKGLTDADTYLESQRRANNAAGALITSTALRIRSRIDLYLALGGDFVVPEPETDLETE